MNPSLVTGQSSLVLTLTGLDGTQYKLTNQGKNWGGDSSRRQDIHPQRQRHHRSERRIRAVHRGIFTFVTPVIDWTEIDTPREQNKLSALGASPQKASWLQRFLFHMGQEESTPHDHGIEVVLPGKKK